MVDPPVSLNARHCLVLDDEFLIALDIQQILEAAGATVTSFSTVADAIKALEGGAQFDVAVLDIRIGEVAGDSGSVAAALASRGTPFVFLTGLHADSIQAQRFPRAPVVEKPYKIEALIAALHQALRSRSGEPGTNVTAC
jgi:CheY-like chemotaxis protein